MTRPLLTLLLAAACVGFSPAARAAVPAFPCHGCTLAQEEKAALSRPGLGVRFVYNFTHHRIRKFAVLLDSANSAAHLDGVPVAQEPADYAKAVPARRDLYEMVVDAAVIPVFTAADNLWATDRRWFSSKQHRAELEAVGQTEGTLGPRAFSPANVAWDGPASGEGRKFIQRLNFMLKSRATTAQLGPGLAEALHDIGVAIQNIYIEVSAEGPTAGISFADGPPKEITVEFCNSSGQCIEVKLSTATNGVKVEYVGATDAEGVSLPSITERAIERVWGPGGREAAGDMGRYVAGARNGRFIGGSVASSCGRIVLACTDAGASYVCQTYCAR